MALDPVNITAPQFVDLGLSTIAALDKSASLRTPATIVGRLTYVPRDITRDHIFGIAKAVRDNVSAKSHYYYKTDFEIWRENKEYEHQNNTRI